MDQSRDYYEVLGVPKDADEKAIRDAFRDLALKYHPDRNKEPGAEDRFKEIAEAYAVLSDPDKRKAYDTRGFAGVAGFSPEDLFGGIDFEDLFGGLGLDLTGFGFGGGLFDRFRRRSGPRPGRHVEVVAFVPLEMVLRGGEWPVEVGHPQRCSVCGGNGAAPGTAPRNCDACGGTGQHVETRQETNVTFRQVTPCSTCGGKGSFIDEPCRRCSGVGTVEKGEKLTLKIPVGVEEGMVLRVPGHGLPSPDSGGSPGDLLVVIRSETDPRFRRIGADLWRIQTIDAVDAVLGTEVEVPTLEGSLTATVPPGTQPESALRLAGKGLPRFERPERGDLYLRIHVQLPESLSKDERALYERLRKLRHTKS